MKISIAFIGLLLLSACDNKKPNTSNAKDTALTDTASAALKKAVQLQVDTLQYLHFEGNFDYWYAVFLTSKKDTVQMVVDNQPSAKLRNKLVEVKWFNDTLFEAGDNESEYAGKRLQEIRAINGKLFVSPVTEGMVIQDIKNLPEVKSNAEQVGIAERPTDDKEYYLVETGTHGEDNFSRLFMFRVYVYPKYEIKFYDLGSDNEMSIDEWRKKK